MAVYIYPKGIGTAQLQENLIKWLSSEKNSPTWVLDRERIIHTADSGQWDEGGYLTLAETSQSRGVYLAFYYKIQEGKSPRTGTYGVYNGRFVQMLMNHFTDNIERIEVKDLRKS